MPAPLAGIFTPNMVPLTQSGAINEDELRRYVEWLVVRGVHGLYPNGSTGEFLRFTPDERRLIVLIVCDQTAGRVPVLAGAAEANVQETLRACETYAQFGARAVAIVSPFYYKLGQDAIFAYFREIAEHSPIDVTLYNIPMLANPLQVRTVLQLVELPRIIGMKDSSGDIGFMLRLMAEVQPVRPDFAFLTGWEPALMPMLIMGCHGGTCAISGVVPEATRRLYDLTKAGRFDEARPVQLQVLELFDLLMNGADFPEGFRPGVAARGFAMGSSRLPTRDVPDLDWNYLQRLIDDLAADSAT
jgi:dihydrodipicolinate synthase/N-acetylneuraminate lyase